MKYTVLLLTIFTSIIIYAAVKYPTGIIGTTKLNGEGCTCHSTEADSTVSVWMTGPDTLQIGQSGIYTIYLTGGPKIKGGYNVAVRLGSLMVVDTFSQKIDVELTHKAPRQFPENDTLSWQLEYIAPSSVGTDTIYSVAQSVNDDEIPTDLDRWNFGNNFVITIVPPVKINDQFNLTEIGFELMQNYPNPFNPSTSIQYALHSSHFVTIKLYDALGNEASTLVNEEKGAGSYEIQFNAENLSTGVYFFKMQVGTFIKVKKMLLLR